MRLKPQSKSQLHDQDHDADAATVTATDDPILSAIHKAVRARGELVAALGEAADEEPVAAPTLPAEIDLAAARQMRDIWAGLVQLCNARGNEAEGIADRLIADDETLGRGGLLRGFAAVLRDNRERERRLQKKKSSELGSQIGDLVSGAEQIGGVKVLTASLDGVEGKELRGLADKLRDQLGSGVLALCAANGPKAALLVAVTRDLTGRFKAGDLIETMAPIIGGRGGGKPEMAQAGGSNPQAAPEAFAKLKEIVAAG